MPQLAFLCVCGKTLLWVLSGNLGIGRCCTRGESRGEHVTCLPLPGGKKLPTLAFKTQRRPKEIISSPIKRTNVLYLYFCAIFTFFSRMFFFHTFCTEALLVNPRSQNIVFTPGANFWIEDKVLRISLFHVRNKL